MACLSAKFIPCPHSLNGPLKDARGPLIAMADTIAGSKTSKNSNTESLGASPTKRGHNDNWRLGNEAKLWLEKYVLGKDIEWPGHPTSEIKLDA